MIAARLRRSAAFALLPPLVLLLASCGGSGRGPVATQPACTSPPEGIGPDAAATLQVEDRGGTYCLNVGDELTVFLRVPIDQESTAWRAIAASDSAVLEPMNAGVLTLPRGVTGAVYRASREGTAQLTSSRPPCAAADAACSADDLWQAAIVVRK